MRKRILCDLSLVFFSLIFSAERVAGKGTLSALSEGDIGRIVIDRPFLHSAFCVGSLVWFGFGFPAVLARGEDVKKKKKACFTRCGWLGLPATLFTRFLGFLCTSVEHTKCYHARQHLASQDRTRKEPLGIIYVGVGKGGKGASKVVYVHGEKRSPKSCRQGGKERAKEGGKVSPPASARLTWRSWPPFCSDVFALFG